MMKGAFKDSRVQKAIEETVAQLIDTAKKLGRGRSAGRIISSSC